MERSEDSCSLVDLPLEVLEVVAGHLRVRDLLACCACSHGMREIFNDNSIWRPRCDKQLCEYLKVTPCKVVPHFITPKLEHSTLSPTPLWKVEFMRQNHLWNNWRQGRKVEEIIESQETARSRNMDNSIFHFFLNSDCIVAVYPNRIEFLDVSRYPIQKAASDIKLVISPQEPSFKVMASDRFVIILYQSIVQVYQVDFSTKESILKNVFFIENSKKAADIHGIKDLQRFLANAKLNYNNRFVTTVDTIGNLLVAIQYGDSKMHIWDVETGLKIKMQDCPINKNASVADFKRSSGKMNIIICVREQQTDCRTFLAYDLTTFTFLPFQETFKGRCGFSSLDKYVAIWAEGLLNVYDYVTSKLLLKNQPIQSHCQGLGTNFVFLENNILKIFFPSSQLVKSLVFETETSFSYKVNWFEILNDKLIQVSGQPGFNLPVYEVDDGFRLKKSSLNLGFQTCSFFLNKTSTRYIVRSGCGNVLHFW